MTFASGETPSVVTEDASNILLNIPSEPMDIYAALDEVFDLQTIERAGKKLSQYKSLQTLPPILQINIPRNTYDRATGRGVKVDHCIHLEDTLYMDRYLDASNDPDVMRRREECWQWRTRLRSMAAEKEILVNTSLDIDGPASIAATSEYLKGLNGLHEDLAALGHGGIDIDNTLLTDLSQDAEFQRHRLSSIDNRMSEVKSKISAQFDGLEKIKYRLYAVFFHRGGYGHGHYFTYIHDFQTNMWRIYNDEKVEEFTKLDDIFHAHTWQQGTPTYAVYVRDDVKEDYVQAVCRDPQQPPRQIEDPTPAQHDEMMEDITSAPAASAPATDPGAAPNSFSTEHIIEGQEGGDWQSSNDAYAPNHNNIHW